MMRTCRGRAVLNSPPVPRGNYACFALAAKGLIGVATEEATVSAEHLVPPRVNHEPSIHSLMP
eukprot:6747087-Alexandrium_andersonii.AAC.1